MNEDAPGATDSSTHSNATRAPVFHFLMAFIDPQHTADCAVRDTLTAITTGLTSIAIKDDYDFTKRNVTYYYDPHQHHIVLEHGSCFPGLGHPSRQGVKNAVDVWVERAKAVVERQISSHRPPDGSESPKNSSHWLLFGFSEYWIVSSADESEPIWNGLWTGPRGEPPSCTMVRYDDRVEAPVYFLDRARYPASGNSATFHASTLLLAPADNQIPPNKTSDLVTIGTEPRYRIRQSPLLFIDYLASKTHFLAASINRADGRAVREFTTQLHHDIAAATRALDASEDPEDALDQLDTLELRANQARANLESNRCMLDTIVDQLEASKSIGEHDGFPRFSKPFSLETAKKDAERAGRDAVKFRDLLGSFRDYAGYSARYREKRLARSGEQHVARITSLLTSLGIGLALAEIFSADFAKDILRRCLSPEAVDSCFWMVPALRTLFCLLLSFIFYQGVYLSLTRKPRTPRETARVDQ